MVKLAISKDFVETFARLPQSESLQVNKMIELLRTDPNHPSLHREHYAVQAEPSAQTIRVNQGLRAIILNRGNQDLVLINVFSHERADYWMANTKASVNAVTGALELCDITTITQAAHAVSSAEAGVDLLNGASDKELQSLGIDAPYIPLLRMAPNRTELDVLLNLLPDLQGEAVSLLADGISVEEAYRIILELMDSQGPAVISDPEDFISAANSAASAGNYFIVSSDEELFGILSQPFALWRIYLHRTQRTQAERVFSGSARVAGGPGTGKTVVALHRARALARRYPQDRILLTTFTTTLAANLVTQLRNLAGAETDGRVDITNIDKLAMRLLRETSPKAVTTPAKEQEITELFANARDETGFALPASFVRQEWEQIVLAGAITSREDYFKAARPGRGVRLNRKQRADVWEIVELVTARLAKVGRRTYIQIASDAAEAVVASGRKRYEHILVDEGQDLHPAHWRLLRALASEGPDDIFIVADSQQRIYDRRVVLSRYGIKVAGRSAVLRLNYRSTAEIVKWAVSVLGAKPTDDLDGGVSDKRAYRSVLSGAVPNVSGCKSTNEELDEVVEIIRGLLTDGVAADEIVIAGRLNDAVDMIANRLNTNGIPARALSEDGEGDIDSVHVATFHRLKGLEYRHVFLVDVSEGKVPLRTSVTSIADDPQQHEEDLVRERSLLFVAATRARDSLHVSYHGKPSLFLP
jgi:AAA domain/UvrD-like helicase C-terminal domain